jgi:hypothetical protein
MAYTEVRRILVLSMIAASWSVLLAPSGIAQTKRGPAAATESPITAIEQPDAERVREELSGLLDRYPPSLRSVLQTDPSLLGNQSYLATYPALASFLNAHPEAAGNPEFYVGTDHGPRRDPAFEMWQNVLAGLAVFLGFGMAVGLVTWLIRTWIDYRRWSRLAKVQTDVHTKLLDRFTGNEDLLAYIQSPAGSKFLESSPITLDAGPRSVAAPLGRILWSVQAGLVLAAAGIGLRFVSGQVGGDASQPLQVLGVLGIALGLGFVISAIISFVISQRLGLIERAAPATRIERPADQG